MDGPQKTDSKDELVCVPDEDTLDVVCCLDEASNCAALTAEKTQTRVVPLEQQSEWPRSWGSAHKLVPVPISTDTHVWPIDHLHLDRSLTYNWCTTIAPPRWAPDGLRPSQAEFSANFAVAHPEVAACLPHPGIMIAGGAAQSAMSGQTPQSDVDAFIIAKTDEEALAVANSFMKRIRTAWKGPTIEFAVYPGLINLGVQDRVNDGVIKVKFQIIMRRFDSPGELLQSFDLQSCKVCYDGRVAYVTADGAYAQAFMVNALNPMGSRYVSRLVKYFDRGYAWTAPHSRGLLGAAAQTVVLPWITIRVLETRGNVVIAACTAMKVVLSEYYGMYYKSMREDLSRNNMEAVWCMKNGEPAAFAIEYPVSEIPDYKAALPIKTFVPNYDDYLKAIVPDDLKIYKVVQMRNILGVTPVHIKQMVDAAYEACVSNQTYEITVHSQTLDPYRAAMFKYFNTVRNYTVQLMKTTMDNTQIPIDQFFGTHYDPSIKHNSVSDMDCKRLTAQFAQRARLYIRWECGMCRETIGEYDSNFVALPCGHRLHMSTGTCLGYNSRIHGSACPTCSANLVTQRPPSTIVVRLE